MGTLLRKIQDLFKVKNKNDIPDEDEELTGGNNNKDKDNENPELKKKKARLTLTAIGICIIYWSVLFQYDFSKVEPETVKYTEFLSLLDEGKIDTVYYSSDQEYMFFSLVGEENELSTQTMNVPYVSLRHNGGIKKTLYPDNTDFREMILLKGADLKLEEGNATWMQLVTSVLPVVLVFAFYIFLFKKLNANSPFSELKDSDLIQTSDVSFDDIIGHDEILDDVKFVTSLLKDPTLGEQIGAKMPKGLLFSGPPGTGKTLLAKAIAHEAGVPFLYQNASSFIEMYVGLGARRVRQLFKKAREHAPCVLFIDEIDAVGISRESRKGTSENEQTINALLQEMDGFSAREGVFVIAATNRPDALDSALTRAGRFDRQVLVNPPADWKVRKELFDHYLKPLSVDDTIDTETLSKQSSGFTGADIAAVCNEAGIIAAMKGFSAVNIDCIEEAMDKKIFKGNRKKAKEEDRDKQIIAYHEAGHAVMSFLLKEPVARISIQSTTSGVGGAVFNEDKDSSFMTDREMRNRILIAYAGRASEEIHFGEVTTGASNDITQATHVMMRYIESLGFDKEFGLLDIEALSQQHLVNGDMITEKLSKMSKEMYAQCLSMLRDNYDKVELVAKKLLADESISGNEFEELVRENDRSET